MNTSVGWEGEASSRRRTILMLQRNDWHYASLRRIVISPSADSLQSVHATLFIHSSGFLAKQTWSQHRNDSNRLTWEPQRGIKWNVEQHYCPCRTLSLCFSFIVSPQQNCAAAVEHVFCTEASQQADYSVPPPLWSRDSTVCSLKVWTSERIEISREYVHIFFFFWMLLWIMTRAKI